MIRTAGQKTRHRVLRYLLVASVVLVCLPRRWTDRADDILLWLLGPLSGGSRAGALAATEHLRRPSPGEIKADDYARLKELYQRQRVRCVNLSQEVARLQNLNSQLARLAYEPWAQRARLIQATVTGSASDGLRQIKLLNRGARDRVRVGQMVLAACGGQGVAENETAGPGADAYSMCVVGTICRAGQRSASLQLLNDRDFRLQAVIVPAAERGESWQRRGIARGAQDGSVTVTQVQEYDCIKTGDVVLARADARDLPVAMFLGTVVSCVPEDRAPVLGRLTVRPGVNLPGLREVIVVDVEEVSSR